MPVLCHSKTSQQVLQLQDKTFFVNRGPKGKFWSQEMFSFNLLRVTLLRNQEPQGIEKFLQAEKYGFLCF